MTITAYQKGIRATLWVAVGILFALTARFASAADEPEKDELERRARIINHAAEKESVFKTALHHVSIETGVPEKDVEAQHRRYPGVGLAGILLANVLAAETKKEPTEFIQQRKAGKGWAAQARAHKVPVDHLTQRLENLDKAIGASTKKPEKDDERPRKK
jgi:hypothetical protein